MEKALLMRAGNDLINVNAIEAVTYGLSGGIATESGKRVVSIRLVSGFKLNLSHRHTEAFLAELATMGLMPPDGATPPPGKKPSPEISFVGGAE